MRFCTNCGSQLNDDVKFCPSCGKAVSDSEANAKAEALKAEKAGKEDQEEGFFSSFARVINSFAGGTGDVQPPPLKTIFGDVFKTHKKHEAEEIFICGTSVTTPKLGEDGKRWPKTWLWSRIFSAFGAAFLLLLICTATFGNTKSFPGFMVIGSFAVPITVMVFFFELNTPKNISFFTVIKYFMVGGCASLVITLLLGAIVPDSSNPFISPLITALIEEPAKLIIVVIIVWMNKNSKYALNGLLIGSAIGAGFAAFESAGYAFDVFLENYPADVIYNNTYMNAYSLMVDNIYLRALLAPGGHVIWAAISGYAIMLVKGDKKLSMSFLNKKAFWMVIWVPIVLHALWNSPLKFGNSTFGVVAPKIILMIIGWLVICVMISNALAQVGAILDEEKRQKEEDEKLTLTNKPI